MSSAAEVNAKLQRQRDERKRVEMQLKECKKSLVQRQKDGKQIQDELESQLMQLAISERELEIEAKHIAELDELEKMKEEVERLKKPVKGAGKQSNVEPSAASSAADENSALKAEFQQLHKELVALDMSPLVDDLFTDGVISARDMQEMLRIGDVRMRSQYLLATLHASEHPQAFSKLRQAMCSDASFKSVVQRLGGSSREGKKCAREPRETTSQEMCRPSLLATLAAGQGDRRVRGLTKLNNALYVVYRQSDTINVYTAQQPHTQLRSIAVNGMNTPTDIAACSINNCLYVSDSGRCVWRVRTDHKVDKWLSVQNVLNLSVTSEGLVVLLIATDLQGSEGSRTYRGRVEVYSAAGVKLTIIKLPDSIVNPLHAVQTANKSFIVGHGTSVTELNRVCEVNTAGNIVTSYGGSRGSGLGQLDMPFHIVLYSEERVLVVDMNNRRVLLLSRQLDIQRVLLSWSRDDPMRLFYDKDTRQLIVGLDSGQVEIYSLQ